MLSGLKADEQLALLRALPELEREAVEQGLAYLEDSAGRLMQRVVVAIPGVPTVGQAIDYLRGRVSLPDDFHDLLLVDSPLLQSARSLRAGCCAAARRRAVDLWVADLHTIPVDMDREEVARFYSASAGLASAPVVSFSEGACSA